MINPGFVGRGRGFGPRRPVGECPCNANKYQLFDWFFETIELLSSDKILILVNGMVLPPVWCRLVKEGFYFNQI